MKRLAEMLLVAVMLCVAAVSLAEADGQIGGTWSGQPGSDAMRITFGEDGSCAGLIGEEWFEGTYAVDGDRVRVSLHVDFFSGEQLRTFILEDGTLTEEGNETVRLAPWGDAAPSHAMVLEGRWECENADDPYVFYFNSSTEVDIIHHASWARREYERSGDTITILLNRIQLTVSGDRLIRTGENGETLSYKKMTGFGADGVFPDLTRAAGFWNAMYAEQGFVLSEDGKFYLVRDWKNRPEITDAEYILSGDHIVVRYQGQYLALGRLDSGRLYLNDFDRLVVTGFFKNEYVRLDEWNDYFSEISAVCKMRFSGGENGYFTRAIQMKDIRWKYFDIIPDTAPTVTPVPVSTPEPTPEPTLPGELTEDDYRAYFYRLLDKMERSRASTEMDGIWLALYEYGFVYSWTAYEVNGTEGIVIEAGDYDGRKEVTYQRDGDRLLVMSGDRQIDALLIEESDGQIRMRHEAGFKYSEYGYFYKVDTGSADAHIARQYEKDLAYEAQRREAEEAYHRLVGDAGRYTIQVNCAKKVTAGERFVIWTEMDRSRGDFDDAFRIETDEGKEEWTYSTDLGYTQAYVTLETEGVHHITVTARGVVFEFDVTAVAGE